MMLQPLLFRTEAMHIQSLPRRLRTRRNLRFFRKTSQRIRIRKPMLCMLFTLTIFGSFDCLLTERSIVNDLADPLLPDRSMVNDLTDPLLPDRSMSKDLTDPSNIQLYV